MLGAPLLSDWCHWAQLCFQQPHLGQDDVLAQYEAEVAGLGQ